jgi:hypothetical protein
MHDWLAWNSALWTLGERAMARNIDPWDIEGGFEWDGWYAPDARPNYLSVPSQGFRLPMTQGFFRHVAGRYALSFTHPLGTVCHDSQPYIQWLPPGERQFFFIGYPSQFHLDTSPRGRASNPRMGSASAASLQIRSTVTAFCASAEAILQRPSGLLAQITSSASGR